MTPEDSWEGGSPSEPGCRHSFSDERSVPPLKAIALLCAVEPTLPFSAPLSLRIREAHELHGWSDPSRPAEKNPHETRVREIRAG